MSPYFFTIAFSGTYRHRHYLQKESVIGETVHLQCGDARTVKGPVDWSYRRKSDTMFHLITAGGYLTNGNFESRLNVNGSTLVINNVQTNDSGIFICIEEMGMGKKHQLRLSVHGKLNKLINKCSA